MLGVDYGLRWIGLAVADHPEGIPTPVRARRVRSTHAAPDAVADAAREVAADAIVVGLPEGLEGEERRAEIRRVRRFARDLRRRLGIPVHFVDESLSSREARERAWRPSGEHEHSAAAAIILGRWLADRRDVGSR